MLLQLNWEFQRNANYSNAQNRTKKPGSTERTEPLMRKYHPAMLDVHCPFFCLRCWTLRCSARTLYAEKRTGSTWSKSMQSKSHLLLPHNVKRKSAPPRMFLYLLVTKTNYWPENTTSVARQDDYFSLCGDIYLPGNTGSYKGWRVMIDITLKSLLPEKCQEIVSALYSEENQPWADSSESLKT